MSHDISHPYDFAQGDTPLLISMPHVGTELPQAVREGLIPEALDLRDTDWHLPRLYDFARDMGASLLAARYSRFAIDLNRSSDDKPLYQTATTGLYPDVLFEGTPLFQPGKAPDSTARRAYLEHIWQPYHDRIASELARLKAKFGYAVLFDAHSIKGEIPRLFEGLLPDFNIGTNSGASCPESLSTELAAICDTGNYRHVVNGRFKGGHITRHYGQPDQSICAVQLELAQRTYMREAAPFDYLPEKADQVRAVLKRFVEHLLDFRP
ncbi:N-formylglutamate deformylase [Dongia soli]|uniref:N-formylglutamate deformylase n=1 Tax=Dongia soli TaxID=600628 RepID=A0ABU5E9I8_9PROT|nr:N-formylglutamate deformylase [Dongia soli]MDY0882988.1 N-formylglutamate deformylase [Dongia soli]